MRMSRHYNVPAEKIHGRLGIGRAIIQLNSSLFYEPTLVKARKFIKYFQGLILEEQIHQFKIERGKTNDFSWEKKHITEVFRNLITSKFQKRLAEIILNDELNYSHAFVKAVNESIEQGVHLNTEVDPGVLLKDLVYFRDRLAIKIEVNTIKQECLKVKEDFILVVSEFRREYFHHPSKYFKGIICRSFCTPEERRVAYILAHELDIPVCLFDTPVMPDDYIILDGDNDLLMINPSLATKADYEARRRGRDDSQVEYYPEKVPPKFRVFASISDTRHVSKIADSPVYSGICTYKTEYTYVANRGTPKVDELLKEYLELMSKAKGKEIFITLPDFRLDANIDELNGAFTDTDTFFENFYTFNVCIHALALAVKETCADVKILIPMIRMESEIDFFMNNISGIFNEFGLKDPPIGIMIETETALESYDEYRKFDFTVIGLDSLIEEYKENDEHIDRFNKISKERLLEMLGPVLRDIHSYFMAYKTTTRHIIYGRCLTDPKILRHIYSMGFKEVAVPIGNIRPLMPVILNNECFHKKYYAKANAMKKKKE